MSPGPRLIVGLGNPGAQYASTPHNLGFWGIDALAARAGIRITRPEAQSYVGLGRFEGYEVVLAKPQTMMNASGVAARMLLQRYESDANEMIVLFDDVALPWEMLRIRERGSAGGHNGLKSVISSIGTDEFIRIRMGIQPERQWDDLADYVLCKMTAAQREMAMKMAESSVDAIAMILNDGVSKAMSHFNRRAVPPDQAEDV